MDRPSVNDLKLWSKVDFAGLDEPFSDAELGVVLTRACDYVVAVTGRPIDATFPAPLVSLGEEAIQMRVEQMVYQAQPDYIETGADDEIQNFSAGTYSESRRTNPAGTGVKGGIPMINPWAALNQRLWLVATDAMREYWFSLLEGMTVPAIETTEVDWGNYDGLYPYSYQGRFGGLDPTVWGA